jgi:hypothetical protein
MNDVQHFTHRPPSSGNHLLSDPFPERSNEGATSLFAQEETLSARRAYIAASKRLRMYVLTKK